MTKTILQHKGLVSVHESLRGKPGGGLSPQQFQLHGVQTFICAGKMVVGAKMDKEAFCAWLDWVTRKALSSLAHYSASAARYKV